jgi:hypothetical protein
MNTAKIKAAMPASEAPSFSLDDEAALGFFVGRVPTSVAAAAPLAIG